MAFVRISVFDPSAIEGPSSAMLWDPFYSSLSVFAHYPPSSRLSVYQSSLSLCICLYSRLHFASFLSQVLLGLPSFGAEVFLIALKVFPYWEGDDTTQRSKMTKVNRERILCFYIRILTMGEMSLLFRLFYMQIYKGQSQSNSNFFVIGKLTRFRWKFKGPRLVKTILKRKKRL